MNPEMYDWVRHSQHVFCHFRKVSCLKVSVESMSCPAHVVFCVLRISTELSETQNYAYWYACFIPGTHDFR